MHSTSPCGLDFVTRVATLAAAVGLTSDAAPGVGAALDAVGPNGASLLLLLLVGMVSGLLSGLLGVGGALVTLPVLYLTLPSLGIEPAQVPSTAVATALLVMLPVTLTASWRQHRRGAIETAWLWRMATPMVGGAVCGALLASALNGPVLALMFAAQSCWYGVGLLWNSERAEVPEHRHGVLHRFVGLPSWLAAPLMASFCACVGMGGGSLVTPFLLHRSVPFRHAVATAAALNLCIALGGTAAFALSGTMQAGASPCAPAAAFLAAGALLSVGCGVSLAHRIGAVSLKRWIGIVNVASAVVLMSQIAIR